MSGNVVFVTTIDYVAAYPSAAAPTTIVSPIASMVHSTMVNATSAVLSIIPKSDLHKGMSMPTFIPSPASSLTGLPLFPSGFATSFPKPVSKPWNPDLAAGFIASIVVMATLLLTLIGYAIFLHFRGKCPNCKDKEDQLKKWEKGELKVITKEMVKAREKLNSQASGSTLCPGHDLERGVLSPSVTETRTARDASLKDLQLPHTLSRYELFWDRLTGVIKTKCKDKGKGRVTQPPPIDVPNSPETAGDRFFTIVNGESLDEFRHSTPPQIRCEPPARRASSVYSQPTDVNPPFQTHGLATAGPSRPVRPASLTDSHQLRTYSTYLHEDWAPCKATHRDHELKPEGSVVSSSLNVFDPRHKARYEDAQEIIANGSAPDDVMRRAVKNVSVIEVQMHPKRRPKVYGGFPDPEEYDNVELNDLWDRKKT